MKHLRPYNENFSEDEIVRVPETVAGVKIGEDSGRVSAVVGDDIYVYIFKNKKTTKFNKSDVTKVKRCKSACDKKLTIKDGERVIYCEPCDRTFGKPK